VFAADGQLMKRIIEGRGNPKTRNLIELAELPETDATKINLTPESLFGRHCAVLGATGGGKSWTVAKPVFGTTEMRGMRGQFRPGQSS
jgi:hypothetical protein